MDLLSLLIHLVTTTVCKHVTTIRRIGFSVTLASLFFSHYRLIISARNVSVSYFITSMSVCLEIYFTRLIPPPSSRCLYHFHGGYHFCMCRVYFAFFDIDVSILCHFDLWPVIWNKTYRLGTATVDKRDDTRKWFYWRVMHFKIQDWMCLVWLFCKISHLSYNITTVFLRTKLVLTK